MNQIQRHKEQREAITKLIEPFDDLLVNSVNFANDANDACYIVNYYETETTKLRSMTFKWTNKGFTMVSRH